MCRCAWLLLPLTTLAVGCGGDENPTTNPTIDTGAAIHVDEPTSSTIWQLGQADVPINWDTGNLAGLVRIELHCGGPGLVEVIAPSTQNDGEYSLWDVSTDLGPTNSYRIRISLGESHEDYSDFFEIATKLTITEPTRETVWHLGERDVAVRWHTGYLDGSVRIFLDRGSAPDVQRISSGTRNDGVHLTWDVPMNLSPASNYRVHIIYDNEYDAYSESFTIANRRPQP